MSHVTAASRHVTSPLIMRVWLLAALLPATDQAASLAPAPAPGSLASLYDCRFWPEPKAEMARVVAETQAAAAGAELGGAGGVFYWWDARARDCVPCSVCPERTAQLCGLVRDTRCVSQAEWLLQHRGEAGPARTQPGDGVVVFRAAPDNNSAKVGSTKQSKHIQQKYLTLH